MSQSFILMILIPMFDIPRNQAARANLAVSATILRANVKSLMDNGAAWKAILDASTLPTPRNTYLLCVRNRTDCSALLGPGSGPRNTREYVISAIYDSEGALIYDHNIPTSGFDENGNPCESYVAAPNPGNIICPFRVTISFYVEACAVGNCTDKPVIRTIRIDYNGTPGVVFNPSRFNFDTRI